VSSEALRREAAVLAKEMGIRPLRTGETRPDGFYLRQHFTGEPVVSDWQAFVVSSPGRETPPSVRSEQGKLPARVSWCGSGRPYSRDFGPLPA